MFQLLTLALAAAALAGATPATAQAVTYAYTPFDLAKCEQTTRADDEGFDAWECKGYGGIAINVVADDERMYISYGPKAKDELASEETLASYNSEGKTIEWRLTPGPDGKPRAFAAIMRWNVTRWTDDKPIIGAVLVVTRLGPGGVCHVGYVDGRANPNANDLAREIADNRARRFRCKQDKPVVRGLKGPTFSGPMVRE